MANKRSERTAWEITPIKYQLQFEPDMKKFIFSAKECITATVNKRTTRIRLNAKELRIKSASVSSGRSMQNARIEYDEKSQQIVLSFSNPVSSKVEINLSFEGIHNQKMSGFYRSEYPYKGRKHTMLTTQFESVSARCAFPCIDEPAAKAEFDVSLIISKELTAISNMSVKFQKLMGSKKLVSFNTTPKMSTYLLYLGVGNFEIIEAKQGKTTVRVIMPLGKAKLAKMALANACKVLGFLEGYFKVRYPLSKLDLIAVPDFAAGAMENWGAITFREYLLEMTDQSPVALRQRATEVIAHEIVHQWFGDLVTMEWWDDIWLNESFATFIAYKAIDRVFPEWDIKTLAFFQVFAPAFAADQLKSTHPINVKVNTPEQIGEIFDEISYEKGGSVLHMLEHTVGEKAFREGLSSYLKRNAYSNATKHDLWDAVAQQTERDKIRIDVPKLMAYWVNNPGYPVVGVEKRGNNAILSQKRFTLVKDVKEGNWPIPLNYLLGTGREQRSIFSSATTNIQLHGAEWVKLNYGQHCLYRVRYQKPMVDRLGALIKQKKIKGIDAWGIENDLFAFARSGRISLEEYLGFLSRYCTALDYPVNLSVMQHLDWIYTMLYNRPEGEKARVLLSKSARIALDATGWKPSHGESSNTKLVRSSAIGSLGGVKDADTIGRCNKLFNQYLKGKPIDPDIKGAVYSTVASNDGKRYPTFLNLYKKEELPEERLRLLGRLGEFMDKPLIGKALAFSLTKQVRPQDAFYIPATVGSNPVGKDLIWQWTSSNWQKLMKMFPTSAHMLDRYVENMTAVSDAATKQQIIKFFKNKRNMRADLKQSLDQTLERIDANIRLIKKLDQRND